MGYALVSRHHNNSTSVFVMPRERLATVTVFNCRGLFRLTIVTTVYRTRPGGGTEDLTTSRGDARRAQTERRSRGWPKVAGVTGVWRWPSIYTVLIIAF
jgi:hypothetical protein